MSKPIETEPEQMMERVARGIAAVEQEHADEWYEKFRWLLNGWKFVPAGRILTAAGTDQQLTFYNCYVVPSPKDSRRGIVDTLSQMMEIMSRGGGVGINVQQPAPAPLLRERRQRPLVGLGLVGRALLFRHGPDRAGRLAARRADARY